MFHLKQALTKNSLVVTNGKGSGNIYISIILQIFMSIFTANKGTIFEIGQF